MYSMYEDTSPSVLIGVHRPTIMFKFLRMRGAAQVTPSHTLRLELVTNASAVGAGVGATAWQLRVSYELLAAASNDSLSATGALPPNQCSGAPLFASRSAGIVSSPGYPTRRYRNSQVRWSLKHMHIHVLFEYEYRVQCRVCL